MARQHPDPSLSAAPGGSTPSITVDQVRRLIQIMDNSDVHELTIERESEGLKLILRKPPPLVEASAYGSAAFAQHQLGVSLPAEPEARPTEPAPAEPEPFAKITAPLVGVFRASLKRGARAAVAVGDQVEQTQFVGAIESLNVMNEVESVVAGRVLEILVRDGQPVEYGQHLMTLDSIQSRANS